MNWLMIETAPKDGTQVMLFYPQLKQPVQIGHFYSKEEFEYGKSVRKVVGWSAGVTWWSFDRGKEPNPTHWMPLPEAPVAG